MAARVAPEKPDILIGLPSSLSGLQLQEVAVRIFYNTSHALDQAQKSGLGVCSEQCERVSEILTNGQKFALPDNGAILGFEGDSFQKALYSIPIKLPYEKIVLEFAAYGTKKSAKLIFPMEQVGEQIHATRLINADYGRGQRWYSDDCFYVLNFEDRSDPTISIERLEGEPKTLSGEYYDDMKINIAKLIIEFCTALACRNVNASETKSPPKILNAARKRKGKTPFYSYRILTIDGASSPQKTRKGTHASPRVHLRRGHVRRLPSGPVWVNAAVVGDKSKGIVAKDYSVTA